MDILKFEPGEAAVIHNVGGRINRALFETLAILRAVSKGAGKEIGEGWTLVVLHHTDCGIIGCYHHAPGLLAHYMGVPETALAALAVTDPYKRSQSYRGAAYPSGCSGRVHGNRAGL